MPFEQPTEATRPLRNLKGEFVMPPYQRGYRWAKEQVTALLDDLSAFVRQKKADDAIYFLQPLVVCGHGDATNDGPWEVIDGQQRLTTLWLLDKALCAILGRRSALTFTLRFDVRPHSDSLLRDIAQNPQGMAAAALLDEDIDQYHIHRAWQHCYGTVEKLQENGTDLDTFYMKFAGNVHVLWHVIPDTSGNAVDHFTRLNMGRIALTSAELSRALLLNPAHHRVAEARTSAPQGQDPTAARLRDQLVQRRQILMGNQWDHMERALREPDFWAFLGGQEQDGPPTRIDFLLDAHTGKPEAEDRQYYSFHALEGRLLQSADTSAQDIWDAIGRDYQLLRSWYEDHDQYHQMGYLLRHGGVAALRELLKKAQGMKKSELGQLIQTQIRRSITATGEAPDLEALAYNKNNADLHKVLFLFNVAYTWQLCACPADKAKRQPRRFPFGLHGGSRWTLEHMEAQNVVGLRTARHWEQWTVAHKQALEALSVLSFASLPNAEHDAAEAQRKSLIAQCENFLNRPEKEAGTEAFDKLSADILAFMRSLRTQEENTHDMHGLGNMALLDGKDNSALNNALFVVKRALLLQKIRRGEYVPLATEAAFMRYFSDDYATDLPYWSAADRAAYLKQIRITLSRFWPELAPPKELPCS